MGALGGVGSTGVVVGGGVVSSIGFLGDGVGEAKFKKCSFLIGDVNSSEDEELRWMVCCDQIGLTLMRAVRRMGREGCEMKDDFVMVVIVFLGVQGKG